MTEMEKTIVEAIQEGRLRIISATYHFDTINEKGTDKLDIEAKIIK